MIAIIRNTGSLISTNRQGLGNQVGQHTQIQSQKLELNAQASLEHNRAPHRTRDRCAGYEIVRSQFTTRKELEKRIHNRGLGDLGSVSSILTSCRFDIKSFRAEGDENREDIVCH